ncbi:MULTISPECIES: DMT family protein [unclassified Campylobacter]|uniref:DMT family protein n=1 Tax=unclassified Campylobacter TaxID=2593542 RepID=UPI003D32CA9D
MLNATYTIALLVGSNIFMTLTRYGHFKFSTSNFGLFYTILISWCVVFWYCFQAPVNRIGYTANGGSFDLWQLKFKDNI